MLVAGVGPAVGRPRRVEGAVLVEVMVTTWGMSTFRCRCRGVAPSCAWGPSAVDVGGVVDFAGVDVGLGDGVCGGALDGLAGGEGPVEEAAVSATDRSVRGRREGDVAGVVDVEGVVDCRRRRPGRRLDHVMSRTPSLSRSMVTTWGMSTFSVSSSVASSACRLVAGGPSAVRRCC